MIRLAVVGVGHWGPNLVRNFHNRPASEVVWVADRAEKRLDEIRKRFPDIRLSVDAEPALADPTVDAVVIATPTGTHHVVAKRALELGKHVLVEKPLAHTVEAGRELCALAAAQKKLLMVGHVFLFNPAVRRVSEYLKAQELGRVLYISMVRTNLGPIRTDVNAAWDLASHDISVANEWLGAVPQSVAATGGSWINPGVMDAVFATLRYPGGVVVNLHASWLNPRKVRDITVVGEKKMLTFDDMNITEPLRIYDKQVTDLRTNTAYADTFASFRSSIREGDILIPRMATGEPLRAECDHFLESVRANTQPRSDGNVGLAVVKVLEALERSLAGNGQSVEVEA